MAKRRRLSLEPAAVSAPGPAEAAATPFPAPRAPVAQVAGEAAASAALREVTAELAAARAEGRLVQRLPLAAVEAGYLLRDRILAADDELQSLIDSLRLHGQRVPIEVTDLGGDRYGLISGWRRLAALRRLAEETGEDRFGHVLALIRRPDTAADAYVAMVEENEIRVGLSYWERARIVARAVEAGVFPSDRIALQRLFAAASRARRSKIGSFLTLYRALDGVLRFPVALSERAGLALAQALAGDPDLPDRLAASLAASPPETPEAERALLDGLQRRAASAAKQRQAGARPAPDTTAPGARSEDLRPGLRLCSRFPGDGPGRLVLTGPAVTPALVARLKDWLAAQA
jgi:ParB family chromosome partitioning protein